MTSEQIKQADAAYILPTYGRCDVALVEGKGCRAKDADGKSYLDLTSGIGVNSLGWCDDEWVAAVGKQAATLQHTSNIYYTQPAVMLAAELVTHTRMDKVFFGNSGAEANEAAIKAARNYSEQKYGQGRSTIVTLQNSFHGRTLATLTATGQDVFHEKFTPLLPGFAYIEANDIDALQRALAADVCAVMFEPIQGEGGVMPLSPDYVQTLRHLCDEKDVLLIADEVQTGIGRTGTLLACEQLGVQPDIVTLAKGLGGGLPIGACLLSEKCSSSLGKGDHGSTFGGNPVACAGALVVMQRMSRLFLAQVQQNGHYLLEALQALPQVDSISGMGLMLGITFKGNLAASEVQAAALQKGLLCLTAKDKLRLLPPLIITQPEIDEAIAIIKQVLEELA